MSLFPPPVPGYTETLAAFQRESAVELLEGTAASAPDLREVVEDFLASRLQSLEIKQAPLEQALTDLAIKHALEDLKVVATIRETTNVLSVKSGVLPKRSWDTVAGRFKS